MPFQSELSVYFDGQDDDCPRLPLRRDPNAVGRQLALVAPTKTIQLRDYQEAATSQCLKDLETARSSLIVLATGLGKTILFCKLIQQWRGRVLVLAHLEELLQNARDDLMAITGEPVGIERARDHHEGERIVVGLIQSVSRRLQHFRPNHFSLIIVDEAHHAASEAYGRVFEHFPQAKIVGLTATDSRADGSKLPFERVAYRMGIREGVEQGYLVPIRGKRVIIESLDLSRVKRKDDGHGDFDDAALDEEMVKNTAAIADVILKDYPWEKGILFFPGCASARLTAEYLNAKEPESAVYIDGTITGAERRALVLKLRSGSARWLCNVGIATEGFNWPEASVVGMCSPTLSKPAYVQRAGRGTRPLAGLLNGLATIGSRREAIAGSAKPSMLILDFAGASADLDLVSHESLLQEEKPSVAADADGEESSAGADDGDSFELDEDDEDSFIEKPNLNLRAIAKGTQVKTSHDYDEFDPFMASGGPAASLNLKSDVIGKEPSISHGQLKILRKHGILDESLSKSEAQKLVSFIAGEGWRLSGIKAGVLRKMYKDILADRQTGFL